MGSAIRIGLGCLAAMLVPVGTALAAHVTPLEVYGKLPSLENVAISPDGSHIAFVRTQENSRLLAVISLADHKLAGGIRLGQEKLRYIEWADDEHLMTVTSTTALPWGFVGREHEYYMLTVFDLLKHKQTLVPDPTASRDVTIMNVLAGQVMVRRINGHTVLFVPGLWVSDMTLLALIRYDLTTGVQRVIRQGTLATRDWLVDEAGDVVAEVNYFDSEQRWELKLRRDGRLQAIAGERAGIEYPAILGFGPSGDTALISSIQENRPVWRLLSLKEGTFSEPLAEHQTLDNPIEDPVTHRMIGGVAVEDDSQYVFFDKEMQSRWRSVLGAFEGNRVRLTSFSGDFTKIVVRVDGAANGFMYELVDMRTHRALPVGQVYEGLEKPLETRRISYKAADGLQIPAYLTLPEGRPATRLPLIVLPHGGPEARDTADFDWWAQALASRGYAVLRPNYRGSSVDWQFVSKGFGQFGRKMQMDLSDGVRYLAKEGIVDPARVCIVGASYGGYAALAGVTLDPGVYRCAVAVAGISDLRRFIEWVNEGTYRNRLPERYWDRYLGITGPKDLALEAISPIKHIDAVSVPVLLIHGRDDTVVPFEQSEIMLKALKQAKKEVELVALKREDHWLSRGETRLQMLQSSVAFLRTHNPPD